MTRKLAFTLLVLIAWVLLLPPWGVFAQLATPVTITSITGTSPNWTVLTASAHHVPLNDPGFCILSSSVTADNICGTASTVADTTHFTVVSSAMATCSSSCGTAQPAPVLMVKSSQPQFGQQQVTACFWVFVTTPVAISGGTSNCSAQFSGNLQTELNAAVAAGYFVEYSQSAPFANSATLGTVQQYFQALQFSYQLQALQPGGFSGHQCDNTGCN